VSKGRAIRWLARRLKIPLGAVLAVGDQWNDIEMLAEVGHGAAMPTAPAEVAAVARYIAPPLREEGVARMIEALVLAPPDQASAAAVRDEPAGKGQRDRRGQRDGENHEAELADRPR
jgi:3-deoxy-D-manno-octulosonate 8-phosphate phosphatase KdsC-like HAD superfamily phosphatase